MRRLIYILFAVLLYVPLSAQNDSVSVPEFEYGMTRKTYEIADIAVEGADSYEDFVLIGFSGLAVGDKIEVPGDQITKAIKRFWKQGLFSNVKIKASKIEGNKIWLVIELEQRPRVSEIRYEGMKKSEREDVEVKAGIRQGSQMTPNLEDHAKTVIKKYFAEKGFHNTEVHVVQRNDPDHPGYVRVLIAVDKKAKTKVGKIYITGNEALTDLQINKAMKKTNDNNIINLFRTKKFVTEEYEKDKQAVIDLAFDGYGTPLGTSMFPSFAKYYDDSLTDYYKPDIEKAKKLLKEAGYPDGFTMTITVPSNYTPHMNTATVLVEQLKAIGVKASVEPIDGNSWLDQVYDKSKFQTTITGLTSDNMTARKLLERFGSNADNNFTKYKNKEYDTILAKALSEPDDKKQTALYRQLERNLTENAANVYLQDMADLVAVRNGLTGLTFYPIYVLDISKLQWKE